MAVNDHGNFAKLYKGIIKPKYKELNTSAKWLYCTLTILENTYFDKKVQGFFRTDEQLAEDTGMGVATVKRAKKELEKAGLINIKYVRWINKETGKQSTFRRTLYKINKNF